MTLPLPKQGFGVQKRRRLSASRTSPISAYRLHFALYGRASLGVSAGPIFAFDDILRIG
jgi:hypothetical protein